jgi:hypothetical protein
MSLYTDEIFRKFQLLFQKHSHCHVFRGMWLQMAYGLGIGFIDLTTRNYTLQIIGTHKLVSSAYNILH